MQLSSKETNPLLPDKPVGHPDEVVVIQHGPTWRAFACLGVMFNVPLNFLLVFKFPVVRFTQKL